MFDIAQRISVIRSLLEVNSQAALTYAALECRLTIEQVCYDRLKISYGHISYEDLKRWQPRDVVRQVEEDANELAASGFTLSMSTTPVDSNLDGLTQKQYEALEYIQLGEQVGLSLNKLGRLWNALSNVALHVRMPVDRADDVQVYGSSQDVRQKVLEAIAELEKLKTGTLLAGAIGANYFFSCITCGAEIRRIEKLLKHEQIINCVNPDCKESYLIHKEGEETFHSRRIANIFCKGCGKEFGIPLKIIDTLRFGNLLDITCESCGQVGRIKLVPVQLNQA